MDPITTAIITALSTGALSSLTEVSKTVITDAYTQIKALLASKFGTTSDVVHAVEQVEAKPDSAGRRAMLQEEITAVKADQDPDLLRTAQTLLHLLQASSGEGSQTQTATGNYIAQADRGSTASVSVGHPREP
jgi:hypothetical protein